MAHVVAMSLSSLVGHVQPTITALEPYPKLPRIEPANARKCAWSYGVSHCSVLFLPSGMHLIKEAAAARAWVARALHSSSNHSVPELTAFNPSIIDNATLLIRVSPARASEWRPTLNFALWLADGKVRRSIMGADPRAVWLDRFTLLALFNRAQPTRQPSGPGGSYQRPDLAVRMHALNLSDAHAHDVPLSFVEGSAKPWEKNWMPFVHRGSLYVSYSLYPTHVVLSCHLRTGACSRKHATTAAAGAWSHVLDHVVRSPRLSVPHVRIRGRFLTVAHFRTAGSAAVYLHCFVELQPGPPFTVVRTSKTFRFFGARGGADGSVSMPVVNVTAAPPIQYIAGAYASADGSSLILTYGAGDRSALITSIAVDEVMSDRLDASTHPPQARTRTHAQNARARSHQAFWYIPSGLQVAR